MANILKKNEKYLFWGGCGVVLIASVVSWFLGAQKLSAETKAGEANIKAIKDQIGGVANSAAHPIAKSITDYDVQIEKVKKNVFDAWSQFYTRQQQTFVWRPVTNRFNLALQGKKPYDEIGEDERQDYQKQFILNEVPRLCKILDAAFEDKVPVDPTATKAPGTAPAKTESTVEPKIYWADRMAIHKKFLWREIPSSAQIWFTQEDLWILEALCKIIAEMNVGAKGSHDATVWSVDKLAIGEAAGAAVTLGGATRVELPAVAATGPATAEGSPAPADGASIQKKAKPAAPATAPAGDPSAAASSSVDDALIDHRYVDADGTPISAAAFKADKTAEFRRLPFHIKLGMDQRKLATLLFKLRNSPWPTEVRSVRFSVPAAGTADDATKTKHTNALNVEIAGIIYLCNPPESNELIKPAAVVAPPEKEKPPEVEPVKPDAIPAETPAEPATEKTN